MKNHNLRCWKKEYSSSKMTRYAHVNTPATLEIYSEKINGKKVPFVAVTGEDSIKDKEFKTKEEANKFARHWMKMHDDNC